MFSIEEAICTHNEKALKVNLADLHNKLFAFFFVRIFVSSSYKGAISVVQLSASLYPFLFPVFGAIGVLSRHSGHQRGQPPPQG